MTLVVNLIALAIIGFIVWWFWLARGKSTRATNSSIDVVVDNGVYTPAVIEVARGDAVILNFLRRDASPCAEQVIFAALDISADLPLGETRSIKLQSLPEGEYEFTCQMGMYRGKLIVK